MKYRANKKIKSTNNRPSLTGAARLFALSLALTLILTLIPALLSGCGKDGDGKTTVLCTVFPVYDWVRNIVGDSEDIEVRLLVDDGTDLHSYQLTVDDVIEIKEAELIIRIGGESDSFMNELLEVGDVRDIRLSEAEGMTLREMSKESHVHEEGEHHDHATDEHIWLSLKNAIAATSIICDRLSELDEENAALYRENADSYIAALKALHMKYESAVASANIKKMIFADRFPFVYITDDYGIEYAAAFEGCTTETDATFETVLRLSDKLTAWQTGCLCVTESSDGELAGRIIDASAKEGTKIIIFDSMQSVTKKDIENGKTYLGIMEGNLTALCDALGAQKG